jgi:hypothetical protein
MDNVKLVLILLVLVFGALGFYFYVDATTVKAQLDRSYATNDMMLQLLRAQGVVCTASPRDSGRISGCIEPLLAQKDFKEDNFQQPDDKKMTSGFLVIKNINKRTYQSENFVFSFDRVIEQEGCTIPGTIDYNIVCRFNFASRCEKGSVLEVNYTTPNATKKVFTKTC